MPIGVSTERSSELVTLLADPMNTSVLHKYIYSVGKERTRRILFLSFLLNNLSGK